MPVNSDVLLRMDRWIAVSLLALCAGDPAYDDTAVQTDLSGTDSVELARESTLRGINCLELSAC